MLKSQDTKREDYGLQTQSRVVDSTIYQIISLPCLKLSNGFPLGLRTQRNLLIAHKTLNDLTPLKSSNVTFYPSSPQSWRSSVLCLLSVL